MAFASLSLHLPSLNLQCGQHSQYSLYFSFISFPQKETSVAGFSITAMLEAQQKKRGKNVNFC
jgi:hypothetical protein